MFREVYKNSAKHACVAACRGLAEILSSAGGVREGREAGERRGRERAPGARTAGAGEARGPV